MWALAGGSGDARTYARRASDRDHLPVLRRRGTPAGTVRDGWYCGEESEESDSDTRPGGESYEVTDMVAAGSEVRGTRGVEVPGASKRGTDRLVPRPPELSARSKYSQLRRVSYALGIKAYSSGSRVR